MLALTCTSCHKKLSVKEEFAGKKVKCPGCGQVMLVPDKVATPAPAANAELPTLAPAGDHRAKDNNDPPTMPPPTQSDATPSSGSEASPDRNLTAYLAPAQADDELGRLGGFRILKILGHGGMGVVFQGEDPKLGRQVAIKAMLPHLAASKSSQERFLREARAAAALEHDHIVPIFHVGEDRGTPFIVMPFLKGESLDGRLKREARLPLVEVLRISREIAAALSAAHERGLIHRDIKPGNVWLETRTESSLVAEGTPLGPRVRILDFGLVRANSGAQHLTQSGAIVGTPAYMAPEQAQNQDMDGRADLFSLGVVLYRLSTGHLPFRGHDTMSTLMLLAIHTPPPPRTWNPDIPEELSALVVKLLAKDPGGRPGSAKEVIHTLQAIEHRLAIIAQAVPGSWDEALDMLLADDLLGLGCHVAPPTKAGPSAEGVRVAAKSRKRILLALGGVLVVLLFVQLVLWWQTSQEEQTDRTTANPTTPPPVKVSSKGPSLEKFRNGLGMEFVLVRKGKFWMGGSNGKPGHKEVEIPHDYYLGVYEVTQQDWRKVIEKNPSYFSRTGGGRKQVEAVPGEELQWFPVENVSWDDAQLFLKGVNERLREGEWLYRLPTEAEWEYGCRGGPFGSKEDGGCDFYVDQPTNALLPGQANIGSAQGRSCKVGSYAPNRLGLYDMHGNVWEWCDDRLGAGAPRRALRGGCWFHDATYCRASFRLSSAPSYRYDDLGLRLARVPVGKEKAGKRKGP